MRLLRLRLANYRGIDESEVRFGPKGITIVEGPNEAGKTSLSEAIRLLFDYLDSSKHSEIKAIKPVTRDVGPEIELEAKSGPYAFTYFKRFHKKPETTLTITSPKPENHTGREAHERAEQILRETIDIDLWKAL
ncbi:MAG: AAA family ATPase, partial [Candidatus Binatia bacterium]